MLLLNFSHPLTPTQQAQIETLTGEAVAEVRDIPAQFDNEQSFAEQVRKLVDSAGLSPSEWQTRPILINPPAYNFAAVTLVAELHGRMGYFPAIVRVRPQPGIMPPRYEVAEILSLQAVRDAARLQRSRRDGHD